MTTVGDLPPVPHNSRLDKLMQGTGSRAKYLVLCTWVAAVHLEDGRARRRNSFENISLRLHTCIGFH
jgi:hypothetical protein